MTLSIVAALFGALGVGSVISQFVAGSAQRRGFRAEALHALAKVESARWVGPGHVEGEMPEYARAFESAALVARLPRQAVTRYLMLANAAFWMSAEAYEEAPVDDFGGFIPSSLADVVRRAATILTDVAWSPWLGRLRLRRKLRDVDIAAEAAAERAEVAAKLELARQRFAPGR